MRYLLIIGLALLAGCGAGKIRVTVAPMPNAVVSEAPAGAPAGAVPASADASGAPVATAAVGGGSTESDRRSDLPDLSGLDTDDDDPEHTVAGLGDPARAGLWMETPLVRAQGPGRVVVAGTARAAPVTLIPVDGSVGGGSRLSLQAMQVLNVPLTDLVTLDVYRGG